MDHQAPAKPGPSPEHRNKLHLAVQRYHRPLVAYARSMTGNLEQARDAAQDTLLRLCQQPAEKFTTDIEPRLAAWLFTVCRNRVIDLHRMERRMSTTDSRQLDQGQAKAATPLAQTEQHDQQDRLLSLVDALPEHQREVVQLRFRGELDYRGIAEATGHSVSYVGVLLHEAIKQLRNNMARLNT